MRKMMHDDPSADPPIRTPESAPATTLARNAAVRCHAFARDLGSVLSAR
jgi:hypothetical protein